jgi:putative mRNA 3-end processing factor
LNRLYEREGVDLGPILPATGLKSNALGGEVVIAPPSATQDRWARRFADPVLAFASGWMGVKGGRASGAWNCRWCCRITRTGPS